jgi:DNA-binding MarR family transcriptional regulator
MTPSTCTNAALRRAARAVGKLYDDALAPSGLRATQYALLDALSRHQTPAAGHLAADLAMDASALAHSLKPLIARGLVVAIPDAADRRVRRLGLTHKGRSALEAAEPHWQKASQAFEATFGVHMAAELRRLADQVATPEFAREFRRK